MNFDKEMKKEVKSMTKRRKAGHKRILALLLSLCIALGGFIIDVMPVQAAPVYYGNQKDLKPKTMELGGTEKWKSGCNVCSVAMLLTAMGKSNATPYDVWKNNNKSLGISLDYIEKNYSVSRVTGNITGNTSNDKKKQIYSLCQKYPYGIVLASPGHYVYAFIESGTLYIHDPGYEGPDTTNPVGWARCIIETNSKKYSDYSSFTGYKTFTDKGGGTPTPTPTQDPITFQTPTYSNVTETTAYVQVNVTADSSQLSKVGMKWDKIVGSTYYHQPEFSWAGSSLRSRISVDFGKEIDKNGNKPTLSPGTKYTCWFYAVTKTGKTINSNAVTFTTKSTAARDTTPPNISNVQVEKYSNGYYVYCDVSDNVGVTKVAFPTWTLKNDQDDLQNPWPVGTPYRQNANGTITYRFNVKASDHNNEQGYYATHIYAYDAAGNQKCVEVSPHTCVDWTKPVISDIKILDQSSTGFTVQCKVTDNVEMFRVRFPVWTEKNGQDDLLWQDGTKNGNIYSFRVSTKDHKNEYGLYHTHIYAYDQNWNEGTAHAPDCTVNETLKIEKSPENYTGKIGETAVFKVAVKGGADPKYQWQKKTETKNWTDCKETGYATSELRFPILSEADDQTEFRCVLKDGSETLFSESAVLSVQKQIPNVPKSFWVDDIPDQTYTGKAVKPRVFVFDENRLLQENIDYTLTYKKNKEVSDTAPNVVVKGIGDYSGTEKVSFSILPKNIMEDDIEVGNLTVAYSDRVRLLVPTVTWGNKRLEYKKDFKIKYPDTDEDAYFVEGRYPIEIVGKGNYTGKRTVQITIRNKKSIKKLTVKKVKNQPYNGSSITPELVIKDGKIRLVEDVDYTVSYHNNVNAGTATVVLTGIGKYGGEKRVSFKITRINIKRANISDIPESIAYAEGDLAIEPHLVIINDEKKVVLRKGEDYTVNIKINKNADTATVIIKGINNYSGTIKRKLDIIPQ